jgi:hypothetical protein
MAWVIFPVPRARHSQPGRLRRNSQGFRMNTDAVVFKKTAAAAGKIRPVTWLGKRWGNHRLPIRGGNERRFFPTRRIETAPVGQTN